MNSYRLNQMSAKNKNRLTSVLIVVTSVLLSFGIHKGGREIHASMLLNQTQTAIQEHRYEDALNYARQANVLNSNKSALKLAYAKNLLKSDNAFKNGENAEKSNKLDDAILSFKQVIEDDKKNHIKAQDKILALTEKVSQLMMQSAKDAYNSQQYENAYTTLQKLLIKNPNFKAARDVENTYQLAAAKQRLAREKTELNSLLNAASKLNITDALKKLNHYMGEDRDAGLKKQAQARIEFLHKQQTQVMNTIDSMKRSNRYTDAIELARNSLYIDSASRESLLETLRYLQTAYIMAEERRNREKDEIAVNYGKKGIVSLFNQNSTARFIDHKVLERDNYGRRLIVFTADVTIYQTKRRKFYFVIVFPENELFYTFIPNVYYKGQGIREHSGELESFDTQYMKDQNSWNVDPTIEYSSRGGPRK